MKTELECEALAKKALEGYVNSCKCNSVEDVQRAIQKMLVMSMHALKEVEGGKRTPVQ